MRIFEIAESELGVSQESIVIRTRKLSGGTQNLGIYLHVADCISNGVLKEFKALQKDTTHSTSLSRHSLINEVSNSKSLSFKIPRIYGTFKGEGYDSIYMEYVQGISSKKIRRHVKASRFEIVRLAKIMSEISLMPSTIDCEEIACNDFDFSELESISGRLKRVNYDDDGGATRALDLVMGNKVRLTAVIERLPIVLCHDDFNWNNIVGVKIGEHLDYYVIDWDGVSFNRIGADLYQFVFYEASVSEEKSFYCELLRDYIAAYNEASSDAVCDQDVMIYAYLYAIKRIALRYLRTGRQRYEVALGHMSEKLAEKLERIR